MTYKKGHKVPVLGADTKKVCICCGKSLAGRPCQCKQCVSCRDLRKLIYITARTKVILRDMKDRRLIMLKVTPEEAMAEVGFWDLAPAETALPGFIPAKVPVDERVRARVESKRFKHIGHGAFKWAQRMLTGRKRQVEPFEVTAVCMHCGSSEGLLIDVGLELPVCKVCFERGIPSGN